MAVFKTRQGYIKAYMDYRIVDKDGNNHPEGEWLYIREMWVHPKHRNKRLPQKLILKAAEHKSPKTAYWLRDKYNERMSYYDIERLKKRSMA